MRSVPDDIRAIWRDADRIARLSDRVFGFGPFNFGLDAALTLIPVAGLVYTVGAGAYLVWLAIRAGAAPFTLVKMAAFVAVDAATSEVPVVGDAVDILFPGHLLAAGALRNDIERRYGPLPDEPRRRSGFGWVRRARARCAHA